MRGHLRRHLALRATWWLAALLLLGSSPWLIGCKKSKNTEASPGFERWTPAGAEGVVFAQRLDALRRMMRAAQKSPLRAFHPWMAAAELALHRPELFERAGLKTDQPAVLFRYQRAWVLLAEASSEDSFEQHLSAIREAEPNRASTLEEGRGLRLSINSHEILALQQGRSALLLAMPRAAGAASVGQGEEEASEPASAAVGVLQELRELPASQRWMHRPAHRRFRASFPSDVQTLAILNPRASIRSLPADNLRARQLRAQMADQVALLGLGLRRVRDARQLSAVLRLADDPSTPSFVQQLHGARGQLPPLGDLIAPGALAVLRLSISPEKLIELVSSTMPVAQREEIARRMKRWSERYDLHPREALVENLRGHAVAVVYGIDERRFRLDNPALLADVLALRATREAIYVPLEDGAKLRRLLDALTQLSQGKLNRKRVGDRVHYAWIDEAGELRWAIVSAARWVIYVDSAAAFAQAKRFSNAAEPRRLKEPLRKSALPMLLGGRDRVGIHLDLQGLGAILTGAEAALLKPWIGNLRSLTIKADVSQRDGGAEIVLQLQKPLDP